MIPCAEVLQAQRVNDAASAIDRKGGQIMARIKYRLLTLLALFLCSLTFALPSFAQGRTTPRGTLKVVELGNVAVSMTPNYAEGLVGCGSI